MKNLPAREKLDLAQMVAEYLVLAGTLDKGSPHDDYDRANELSLELAMLLPSRIYRGMIEAGSHPGEKVNPATVALMMRKELIALDEGDLSPGEVAFHSPRIADRPQGKAH
jgi:hypothetical protein